MPIRELIWSELSSTSKRFVCEQLRRWRASMICRLVWASASHLCMGESSKRPKSWTFEISILKLAVCLLNIHNFKIKWSIVLRRTENKSEKLIQPPNSAFWGWLSVESHPQNPEFRISSTTHLLAHKIMSIFICLFLLLYVPVNSCGHGGTVSSPKHTFSWAGLNKRSTSNLCTYFRS